MTPPVLWWDRRLLSRIHSRGQRGLVWWKALLQLLWMLCHREKNNEEGNHCRNLRGALGSRVSVFPAMDKNNMNICCSKLNHTYGRLFCLENWPSHIEIFHTCNNKPLFVQHYTFYVHQTNSLKFPVRSSISDHNIKAPTHTYSHCSGITFLATSRS